MKPLDLLEYLIKLTTQVGDWVLDPFAGSGSTLLACHNLNRKCYSIEFDPKYCDVIIERYENQTGEKAVKITEEEE